ncbi:flagellar export chaperone FliS [uncultured Umboniibacter sp.]|uniref:flagellar export chaperone FliS n=1 Tax=uncultured Umboniibacter sp. TaxID=1798917 RepID=UPI00262BA285|nr:flagellar export chaperone FliS [uncultured Umboniibacter sp.]
MLDTQGYQHYQAVNVDARAASASPEELMVMLIDAVLDELPKIGKFIEENSFDLKAQSVDRAMRIIEGLESALNDDADATLRKDLSALYQYSSQQVFKASIDSDLKALKDVKDILSVLRSAWFELGAKR